MTLRRTEVIAGTAAELAGFSDLVARLAPREWHTPTRCAGWTVADVAGHVTGFVADAVAGRFADLAQPGAPERQAAERRGRAAAEVATELTAARQALVAQLASFDDVTWNNPAPGRTDRTVGFGVQEIWYNTYVHADDIRDALGQPTDRGPGLRAAVSHLAGLLTQQGWGPATLELDGLGRFQVGRGGPILRADPVAFVLVATGRAHPIEIGVSEPLNVYAPLPGQQPAS